MKRLRLPLLGSTTIIQAATRPWFTYVLRCHMSSLKGKDRNLLSSNSVAGAQILACWSANPNVHWLLITVQLPTTELHKRLSIIFLWVKFPQRYPIHIFNPLLKTVCVFGGRWGAQYYSAPPEYNKTINNFRNWLSLLVPTC